MIRCQHILMAGVVSAGCAANLLAQIPTPEAKVARFVQERAEGPWTLYLQLTWPEERIRFKELKVSLAPAESRLRAEPAPPRPLNNAVDVHFGAATERVSFEFEPDPQLANSTARYEVGFIALRSGRRIGASIITVRFPWADLAITRLRPRRAPPDEVAAYRISNRGTAFSPPFEVIATPAGRARIRLDVQPRSSFPPLAPQRHTDVSISTDVGPLTPATYSFSVQIKPGEPLLDLDSVNNNAAGSFTVTAPPVTRPPATTPGRPAPGASPGGQRPLIQQPLVIVALIVVCACIIVASWIAIRAHVRLQWQDNAREEEPPNRCTPRNKYCRKIKLEAKLEQRNVAAVSLTMYPRRERHALGHVPVGQKTLKQFRRAYQRGRAGRSPEKTAKLVEQLSGSLLQLALDRVSRCAGAADVCFTAHLEGAHITCEFVLYQCVRTRQGTNWKQIDKWTAKIKDRAAEPFAELLGLELDAEQAVRRHAGDLESQLMRYITGDPNDLRARSMRR